MGVSTVTPSLLSRAVALSFRIVQDHNITTIYIEVIGTVSGPDSIKAHAIIDLGDNFGKSPAERALDMDLTAFVRSVVGRLRRREVARPKIRTYPLKHNNSVS